MEMSNSEEEEEEEKNFLTCQIGIIVKIRILFVVVFVVDQN